ncbi:MAG: radical SAM protein [Aigarchaeota archaeon]|nr:radical SAM protein [Aigarchaeota archaeon]MCX8193516.1 radical SAM protein [Nitrososphaeria archaeon]MDW7986819.1 radical SAM protein [Nitrososphaerota archaeon]
MYRTVVEVDAESCRSCRFCIDVNRCMSSTQCIGCLSCYWSCPHTARKIRLREVKEKHVNIWINGVKYLVPYPSTLKQALESVGIVFSKPGSYKLSSPCNLGGCWACSVIVDGKLERTCVTPVREGLSLKLDVEEAEPLRIVHGPQPHRVGGKGTPWWEVGIGYVEAAIWVAGCNLRCPQCQNYHVTYDNVTDPVTPKEAARIITLCSRRYDTRGIAISGGEPTLNRRWLIKFFEEAKKLNPDKRLHLDSNGTIITEEYVDELVEAGCNNIGIEPKASRLETYMKITGIGDRELARSYHENSWNIIKYILDRYSERVYLGVGFAYNREWMTLDEVEEIGDKVASIDRELQVTVLDYFPSFRRRTLSRPSVEEMLNLKRILEDRGLRTVIVQTSIGHFGPVKESRTY